MYGEESTFTSGMKVYTTLDYRMQRHAKKTIDKYIELGNRPYWIKGEKVPSLNFQETAILSNRPTKWPYQGATRRGQFHIQRV